MPMSIGVIGGKPSQALYFIGYTGDDVVFLDPHVTQNNVDLEPDSGQESVANNDASYHSDSCSRMSFLNMDPSLAVVRSGRLACRMKSKWMILLLLSTQYSVFRMQNPIRMAGFGQKISRHVCCRPETDSIWSVFSAAAWMELYVRYIRGLAWPSRRIR